MKWETSPVELARQAALPAATHQFAKHAMGRVSTCPMEMLAGDATHLPSNTMRMGLAAPAT